MIDFLLTKTENILETSEINFWCTMEIPFNLNLKDYSPHPIDAYYNVPEDIL